uniref:hypothetical protein n=1 Tax=Enterococcus faecalis TaxID=1351 RepID=UPI002032E15B
LDDSSSQIENLKYIQIIFLRAHLHTTTKAGCVIVLKTCIRSRLADNKKGAQIEHLLSIR